MTFITMKKLQLHINNSGNPENRTEKNASSIHEAHLCKWSFTMASGLV